MVPRRSLRRWSGAVSRLRRQARADYRQESVGSGRRDRFCDDDETDDDADSESDDNNDGAGDRLGLLAQYARQLSCGGSGAQLEAAKALSKQLSIEDGSAHVIPRGVIPRLVRMLGDGSQPQLQAEAAKCISSLTWSSAAHARVVLDVGAGPVLAGLLSSPDANVRERAVCSIGNIAGSSVEARDRILAVRHLVRNLLASLKLPSHAYHNHEIRKDRNSNSGDERNQDGRHEQEEVDGEENEYDDEKEEEEDDDDDDDEEDDDDDDDDAVRLSLRQYRQALPYLRNGTWALKWLCAGRPQPDIGFVRRFAGALGAMVQLDDDELLVDACCALAFLSEGPNSNIQAVQDSGPGVVGRLVDLLSHQLLEVRTSALRTVGNCVTGEDEQTQQVVDAGAVPVIGGFLSAEESGTRKEALWTLSNITAGTREQIQAVLDAEHVMPLVVQKLATEDAVLAVEAVWVISNLFSGGDHEQIMFVVDEFHAVKELARFLQRDVSPRAVQVAMEGLENICRVGSLERENKFLAQFEKAGLVALFEEMSARTGKRKDEDGAAGAAGGGGGGGPQDEQLARRMLDLLHPQVDNFGLTFKRSLPSSVYY